MPRKQYNTLTGILEALYARAGVLVLEAGQEPELGGREILGDDGRVLVLALLAAGDEVLAEAGLYLGDGPVAEADQQLGGTRVLQLGGGSLCSILTVVIGCRVSTCHLPPAGYIAAIIIMRLKLRQPK